jgi:hypothetical protein
MIKRQRNKDFSWSLLHNLLAIFSIVSLLTGMRIATLNNEEMLFFSALLPQGYVHGIHLFSAIGLIATVTTYFLYKYIIQKQYNINLIHIILLGLIFSGLSIYFSFLSSIATVLDVHYYLAIVMFLWIINHFYDKVIIKGLQSFMQILNFNRLVSKRTFATIVVLAIISSITVWIFRFYNTQILHVAKIPNDIFIKIDGVDSEAIWKNAKPVTIHAYGGANFKDGATDITVKALHNDKEIYFLITWDDPTKSIRHLPLMKTKNGWKVIQDGFYSFDERSYYEDKLAIMFSKNGCFGASKTAHLGAKPLKDKQANWSQKGYHYTTDNSLHDLWQWKATRSNHMSMATDCYFAQPATLKVGKRRYKAGYQCDDKYSGGFTMNYKWYKKDIVTPKRMPRNPQWLDKFQISNQNLEWIIPWYDFKPYNKNDDNYSVGTIMPSVIYKSNKEEGDRADVSAFGIYKNGKWQVELVRFLNTNSKYDLEIKTGMHMWVSAFDHVQIAHTRESRALYLELEK